MRQRISLSPWTYITHAEYGAMFMEFFLLTSFLKESGYHYKIGLKPKRYGQDMARDVDMARMWERQNGLLDANCMMA